MQLDRIPLECCPIKIDTHFEMFPIHYYRVKAIAGAIALAHPPYHTPPLASGHGRARRGGGAPRALHEI